MNGVRKTQRKLFLNLCAYFNRSAITGDAAKFGLGLLSIVFDTIFIIQHYLLYTDRYDEALIKTQNLDEQDENGRPLLPSVNT
eukprot:m.140773 g.140773  ORF g.140773 m.140773 type:complete len:83 (+) comp24122_c0_seq3:44-292(+)